MVLEGLVHLAQFLVTQSDIIENNEEEDKKRLFVNGKIPQEIVKDPSGLARELLWRVKRELGEDVDLKVESDKVKTSLRDDPPEHVNGGAAKSKLDNATNARKAKKMRIIPSKSRTTAFSPL